MFAVSLVLFAFASCGDDDTVSPKKATNRVLELDGDGDYVSVPIASHTFVTFTVEVKVKVPNYNSNVHFVSLQQNAYLVIGDWDGGCISSWADNLSPLDAADAIESAITADEWHHFAISYDGTNQYVLIDGVVVAERATTGTVTNSASYASGLKIGCRYSGAEQFVTGQIDEVRVWNIFRTETQIRDNMNKTISAQTGLVGYWNFDDGTAADLSGNDADGTLVGDAAIVKK
ncbi:MAG: LamG domain-containing protein [Candidatus Krumholzibacteria bacterium]|nr:LamG domain-containing protein [Candidatus Krumholzibacteria bacterium]